MRDKRAKQELLPSLMTHVQQAPCPTLVFDPKENSKKTFETVSTLNIKFKFTSIGGSVGAKLCFLLSILVRLLSIFFFLRQHKNAHMREQQPLFVKRNFNFKNLYRRL